MLCFVRTKWTEIAVLSFGNRLRFLTCSSFKSFGFEIKFAVWYQFTPAQSLFNSFQFFHILKRTFWIPKTAMYKNAFNSSLFHCSKTHCISFHTSRNGFQIFHTWIYIWNRIPIWMSFASMFCIHNEIRFLKIIKNFIRIRNHISCKRLHNTACQRPWEERQARSHRRPAPHTLHHRQPDPRRDK